MLRIFLVIATIFAYWKCLICCLLNTKNFGCGSSIGQEIGVYFCIFCFLRNPNGPAPPRVQWCNVNHIFPINRNICQPLIEPYLKFTWGNPHKAEVNIYCIERSESCQIKIINTLTIQDSIVFFSSQGRTLHGLVGATVRLLWSRLSNGRHFVRPEFVRNPTLWKT